MIGGLVGAGLGAAGLVERKGSDKAVQDIGPFGGGMMGVGGLAGMATQGGFMGNAGGDVPWHRWFSRYGSSTSLVLKLRVYLMMNKVLRKVPILLLKIIRAWAMALLVLWAAVFLPRRWLLCSADHRWVKQVAYSVTPISSVIR